MSESYPHKQANARDFLNSWRSDYESEEGRGALYKHINALVQNAQVTQSQLETFAAGKSADYHMVDTLTRAYLSDYPDLQADATKVRAAIFTFSQSKDYGLQPELGTVLDLDHFFFHMQEKHGVSSISALARKTGTSEHLMRRMKSIGNTSSYDLHILDDLAARLELNDDERAVFYSPPRQTSKTYQRHIRQESALQGGDDLNALFDACIRQVSICAKYCTSQGTYLTNEQFAQAVSTHSPHLSITDSPVERWRAGKTVPNVFIFRAVCNTMEKLAEEYAEFPDISEHEKGEVIKINDRLTLLKARYPKPHYLGETLATATTLDSFYCQAAEQAKCANLKAFSSQLGFPPKRINKVRNSDAPNTAFHREFLERGGFMEDTPEMEAIRENYMRLQGVKHTLTPETPSPSINPPPTRQSAANPPRTKVELNEITPLMATIRQQRSSGQADFQTAMKNMFTSAICDAGDGTTHDTAITVFTTALAQQMSRSNQRDFNAIGQQPLQKIATERMQIPIANLQAFLTNNGQHLSNDEYQGVMKGLVRLGADPTALRPLAKDRYPGHAMPAALRDQLNTTQHSK